MANIVDVTTEPGNLEELEKSLAQAVAVQDAKDGDTDGKDGAGNNVQKSDDNPLAGTKFEGKSVEEVLDSYKNLESAYGRMANDLGTQRKLTDRLLDLKREDDLQRNAPPAPKVDAAQLLDDPTQALDQYNTEREARIRQDYEDRLQQLEAQMQADRFTTKHPDYAVIGNDEKFKQWALGSPLRAKIANQAANGDWEAADALLSEYKALPQTDATPASDNASNDGVEAARQVALESSGQTGDDSSSGRTYRRADLIQLKLDKPQVYEDPAFQAEILKAYAEGRVK